MQTAVERLILNRKEAGAILSTLSEEYGCDLSSFLEQYAFFKSSKDKIYLVTRAVGDIPLEKLRINSVGMYFCELNRDEVRLSIEGSQVVGPLATKGVLAFDDAQAWAWLAGEDIPLPTGYTTKGYYIVKHGRDFLGAGKVKDDKLCNFVPKARRINPSTTTA